MENVNIKVVLSVFGLIIALWQIHDSVYAKDIDRIDSRIKTNEQLLRGMLSNNKTDLILQKLQHNKESLDYLRDRVQRYEEKNKWQKN